MRRPFCRRRFTRRVLAALGIGAGLSLAAPGQAAAQGSCTVNFRAACVVGGTAAYGMNLTISAVVRVSLPAATVALPAASPADFTAGFGSAATVPITIRANTGWSINLAATAPTWTGTGPTARADKPAADLQWAIAPGGPFTNVTVASTGIATGGATAGQVVNLHLRSVYSWTLDTPGAYSLPLQLTITAP